MEHRLRPSLDRARFVIGDAADHPGLLHCESLAARSHIHGWAVEAHFHAGLTQVLVFAGGRVEAMIDGSPRRIEGPAVLWLPALCSHAFRYPPDMQGWSITLPASDVARIAAEAPWCEGWIGRPQVLEGAPVAAILPLIETIEREAAQRGQDRRLALDALFRLLLIQLARGMAEAPPDPAVPDPAAPDPAAPNRQRQVVAQFLRRLEAEAPLPGVAALAAELAVTRTHLARCLRAVTGRTASDLMADERLLRARRRLAFTGEPISAIAYDLGFSSPSYFTRFFVARTGESPRAFRAGFRARATLLAPESVSESVPAVGAVPDAAVPPRPRRDPA